MLPFAITLRPGDSPYRQIVYAATKAIVAGELAAGARFPSVRELSQALKVIRDGLLEVRPGVGTVVLPARKSSASERRALLSQEVEQLVVEAKRLGLKKDEVVNAVSARWAELSNDRGDE